MIHGSASRGRRVQNVSVSDISSIMIYLVTYCAPAAFVINLVGYGANVIISAATGKGVKL